MPDLRVLAAVLVAAFALPSQAQPVLPDSATTYASPLFGIGHVSSLGTAYVVGLDAGRRLGPGVDLGVRVLGGDLLYGENGAFVTAGPVAGYTRSLGGVDLDVRGLATVTLADLGFQAGGDGFGLQTLRGTAQATLSRPLPVVGSLRLTPTLGGYATACATPGYEPQSSTARCAEAGALVGVDVGFRLFGAGVSFPLVVPVRVVGNDDAAVLGAFDVATVPVTGGLRLRF